VEWILKRVASAVPPSSDEHAESTPIGFIPKKGISFKMITTVYLIHLPQLLFAIQDR